MTQGTQQTVNKWLITIAVMLPTIMEIVDTSVANVALPHMQGSLNAGTDEVTWVLTSYLVSNAVVLPMTGWLARTFGRKRFLITCISLFTLASLLCGLSPNLATLIFFRILQGLGGGSLEQRARLRIVRRIEVLAEHLETFGDAKPLGRSRRCQEQQREQREEQAAAPNPGSQN